MVRARIILGALCLVTIPGFTTERATAPARDLEGASRREILGLQATLEAEGCSPGLLDGLAGPKTRTALRAFQLREGLPPTGSPDAATRRRLGLGLETGPEGSEAVVRRYTVTREDEQQVAYCPPDWVERSLREKLLYSTLSSLLAEKFHTTQRCLAFLNPDAELTSLKAGDGIVVPVLRESKAWREVEEIEIDLERKLILILDGLRHLRGLLHCSVARNITDSVRGECRVITVVANPEYTFDPKYWPAVTEVNQKLSIPAGPRSPVGLRWIGLDRPGVGIHGTPEPENIGKTGSHGCFRLTNWDAVYLASIVSPGTRVRILDRSPVVDRLTGK